jgi:hypothetical protein
VQVQEALALSVVVRWEPLRTAVNGRLLIFADLGEGVGQDPAHGYQTLTSSQPRPRC